MTEEIYAVLYDASKQNITAGGKGYDPSVLHKTRAIVAMMKDVAIQNALRTVRERVALHGMDEAVWIDMFLANDDYEFQNKYRVSPSEIETINQLAQPFLSDLIGEMNDLSK